jgi:hypothetical protein
MLIVSSVMSGKQLDLLGASRAVGRDRVPGYTVAVNTVHATVL